MTKKLSVALAAVAEIEARLKKGRDGLARIQKQKDAVIETATSSDDDEALEKLNALASQESLVTRQLQIAQRELDGQAAALLNEASHTRAAVLEALRKQRAAILAKLDAALAVAYPNARDRSKALASLKPVPPALFQIEKSIAGVSAQMFHAGQVTEIGFARNILNTAERAMALNLY